MPTTMDVKETASYLGISKDVVYDMIRRKEIPFMKFGGQYFFRKEALDEWMTQQEQTNWKQAQ